MRLSAKGFFDASATSSERAGQVEPRFCAGRPASKPAARWAHRVGRSPARQHPGDLVALGAGDGASGAIAHAIAALDGPDDRHGMPMIGERVDGARRLSRAEGRQRRPRSQRCHRVRPEGTAHGDTWGNQRMRWRSTRTPTPRGGRELVQSARQAPSVGSCKAVAPARQRPKLRRRRRCPDRQDRARQPAWSGDRAHRGAPMLPPRTRPAPRWGRGRLRRQRHQASLRQW